ncbi:MAG: nucleotide exchange factor GrpE [Bdellovibrionota bacterium]
MSDTNTNSDPELDPKEGAEASETLEGQTTSDADRVVDEWKNKVVYLAAEMENMKKRFVREKSDVIKMANEELIKAMIPVFDNLDLGLKAIRDMEAKADGEPNKIVANLVKGVEMTLTHFQQTLERAGVQKIESIGKPFDPSLHEAMGQSSTEGFEDNQVSAEFQKGFSLHGRVIRPAKVIINKKVSAS